MEMQNVQTPAYYPQETLAGSVETSVNNNSDDSIFTQEDKSFTEKFRAWTKDEDKVCTDGLDDGNLSFKEGLASFGKGFACLAKVPFQFADSVKNAIDTCKSEDATLSDKIKAIASPLSTVGMVAGLTAATALSGGAILPFVIGATAVAGTGLFGYGLYQSHNAKTDGEAKQAFEKAGTGLFMAVSAGLSAGKAIEAGSKAGVSVANATKNPVTNVINCIKATPDSLKVGKANIVQNLTGVIQPNSTALRTNLREAKPKNTTSGDATNKYTFAEPGSKVKTANGVETVYKEDLIMIDSDGNPRISDFRDFINEHDLSRLQKVELRDYATEYTNENGYLSFERLNDLNNMTPEDMADINPKIKYRAYNFNESKDEIARHLINRIISEKRQSVGYTYDPSDIATLRALDDEDLFWMAPKLFDGDYIPSYGLDK